MVNIILEFLIKYGMVGCSLYIITIDSMLTIKKKHSHWKIGVWNNTLVSLMILVCLIIGVI